MNRYYSPFSISFKLFSLLSFFLFFSCAKKSELPPVISEGESRPKIKSAATETFELAVASYDDREFERAIDYFLSIVDNHPDTYEARESLLYLGNAYSDLKQYRTAIQYLSEFLDFAAGKQTYEARLSLHDAYSAIGESMSATHALFDVRYPPPSKYKSEFCSRIERAVTLLEPKEMEDLVNAYPENPLTAPLLLFLAERAIKDDSANAIALAERVLRVADAQEYRERALQLLRLREEVTAIVNTLGVVLPMTGRLGEFGRNILEGIRLAIYQFNHSAEVPANIIIEDDAGESFRAALACRKLAEDKSILAIIGPIVPDAAVAATLVAEENSVPLITMANTNDRLNELGSNIYSINYFDDSSARDLAYFSVQYLGLRTFAIIYPDNSDGKKMSESFRKEVIQNRGQLLISVKYQPGTTTFESELKLIKIYSPDAVFIPASSVEDIVQIVPQIPYYKLQNVQLLGSNAWNSEKVIRLGSKYAEGAIFTDTFFKDSKILRFPDFASVYEQFYRKQATRIAGLGYDAANFALQILENRRYSRAEFIRRLTGVKQFVGVTGKFTLLPGGVIKKSSLIAQIHGDQAVELAEVQGKQVIPFEQGSSGR